MGEMQIEVVARHRTGSTDPETLDELIAEAWSKAVDNPTDRAQIEAVLGLSANDFKETSPFRVKIDKAGLIGGEIVVVFAVAFATAYAKKLGTTAGNAAADLTVEQARRIWPLITKWMFRSDPEVLGASLDESGT